jgi:hypothetical protein
MRATRAYGHECLLRCCAQRQQLGYKEICIIILLGHVPILYMGGMAYRTRCPRCTSPLQRVINYPHFSLPGLLPRPSPFSSYHRSLLINENRAFGTQSLVFWGGNKTSIWLKLKHRIAFQHNLESYVSTQQSWNDVEVH